MYQVYSVQQPGRPRLALTACGLLLLLTLAGAAALVRKRTLADQVDLTEPRPYPQARAQARVPVGWIEAAPDHWPPGVFAGFDEPESSGPAARRVFLFRGPPDPAVLPLEDGPQILAAIARKLVTGDEMGYVASTPAQVGTLPAATLSLVRLSVDRSEARVWATSCLGRVGVAPGGQTLGVLLVIPNRERPRRADHALLDQLCQHLEATDVKVVEDAVQAMTDAGISFEPPVGVRLVANDEPAIPRLRLTPAQSGPCWLLDVCRVPLIEGRTPAMLVEDCANTLLRETELPGPVETARIGDRLVVSTSIPTHRKSESTIQVLCAQTDQRTALLLIGRHEPQAGDALNSLCRSILTTAQVRGSDDLLDPGQARQTAREWLNKLRRPDGLAAHWGLPEQRHRVYAVRSPATLWGQETHTIRRDSEDQAWMIGSESRLTLLGEVNWRGQEVWRVPDNPAEYELVSKQNVEGYRETTYHERGRPRTGQVERRLVVTRKNESPNEREGAVAVDEVFACEPVLLAIGGLVAHDPQRRPALCSALEAFAARPAPWIMMPSGQRTLPGTQPAGPTWAVRVMRDYCPAPITFYYDQAGLLVAVHFDEGEWRELMEVRNEK